MQPLTVKRLVQVAPADKMQKLKELFTHDAAVDAAAIQEWRRQLAGFQEQGWLGGSSAACGLAPRALASPAGLHRVNRKRFAVFRPRTP